MKRGHRCSDLRVLMHASAFESNCTRRKNNGKKDDMKEAHPDRLKAMIERQHRVGDPLSTLLQRYSELLRHRYLFLGANEVLTTSHCSFQHRL